MSKKMKLGILGFSDGNGHPYSWSAIFNGYNPKYMEDCGFPVIPRYLEKQTYPDDCIENAKVTHIWTQDKEISNHIAMASNIDQVVGNYKDMIGQVDAILLARDDSENHFEMAKPFIEAGLPIYIDKPLMTTLEEAHKIYALEKNAGQIFTCSALGYAPELVLDSNIGEIKYIDACVIKDWQKYSIHIIEPVLKLIKNNAEIIHSTVNRYNECTSLTVNLANGITLNFKSLNTAKCGLKVHVYGTEGAQEIQFLDTFNAFKNALFDFVQIVRKERQNKSKEITLKAIEIIERGNND